MNRFDIVEGHFAFYEMNHGGQGTRDYARLSRIGQYFKPSWSWDLSYLSEASREVYNALAAKRRTRSFEEVMADEQERDISDDPGDFSGLGERDE